jgi:hypothetical protein
VPVSGARANAVSIVVVQSNAPNLIVDNSSRTGHPLCGSFTPICPSQSHVCTPVPIMASYLIHVILQWVFVLLFQVDFFCQFMPLLGGGGGGLTVFRFQNQPPK